MFDVNKREHVFRGVFVFESRRLSVCVFCVKYIVGHSLLWIEKKTRTEVQLTAWLFACNRFCVTHTRRAALIANNCQHRPACNFSCQDNYYRPMFFHHFKFCELQSYFLSIAQNFAPNCSRGCLDRRWEREMQTHIESVKSLSVLRFREGFSI